MPEITKMTIVSLIFVRFSIRNQRWKAKKVSFFSRLLDMTLLERPTPLLGRLRVPCTLFESARSSKIICYEFRCREESPQENPDEENCEMVQNSTADFPTCCPTLRCQEGDIFPTVSGNIRIL